MKASTTATIAILFIHFSCNSPTVRLRHQFEDLKSIARGNKYLFLVELKVFHGIHIQPQLLMSFLDVVGCNVDFPCDLKDE